jgi:hypothetical protein
MASRSAIACSSALPGAFTCWSAAAVSSTAVFRVSVAKSLLHGLRLLLGELAQAAHQVFGISPEWKAKSAASLHRGQPS